jgi:hypothetical protein
MKVLHQIAIASLVLGRLAFAPASASAASKTESVRQQSITYHDRTPKVHNHGEPHTHHQHIG